MQFEWFWWGGRRKSDRRNKVNELKITQKRYNTQTNKQTHKQIYMQRQEHTHIFKYTINELGEFSNGAEMHK